MTCLASALAEQGGFISREEAVKLLRTEKHKSSWTPKKVFDSVVKKARQGLAKKIKEAISRVAGTDVSEDAIPWDDAAEAYRCEFRIGFAEIDDEGRIVFKTHEQRVAMAAMDL